MNMRSAIHLLLHMEKKVANTILRMENSSRDRLLDAGLQLLGTVGVARTSARAAEESAGLPHGSIRHHFGSYERFLEALVEHLRDIDQPRGGETLSETLARWLGPEQTFTRARYELMLAALNRPRLREHLVAARELYVSVLASGAATRQAARDAVAALDGLVLDALLRGDTQLDPSAAIAAIAIPSASTSLRTQHGKPEPDR